MQVKTGPPPVQMEAQKKNSKTQQQEWTHGVVERGSRGDGMCGRVGQTSVGKKRAGLVLIKIAVYLLQKLNKSDQKRPGLALILNCHIVWYCVKTMV